MLVCSRNAVPREVLRTHEGIVREALKAHRGSEVKTMGDGFMASSEAHVLSDVSDGKRAALVALVRSVPLPIHWSLL